ncbi:uncharacterized protein LOC122030036 [Zingiber officinale]|uniref:Uncharacterized protein n=1 Tax=Zingiber officinale TaxID=94328 RepID=A0A8J5I6Z0_ZINOF|nr:uncharacterized protein LOC122030036 [Zingiber officinale]XP_042445128.1 uncharacterized protein LOC122030036 [Zingiber officinale]XP_042445135.1 uncharacterized protein LOC122030036 [Zingiber officinale]XP_042445143.1 uncharacterized protein LOC122030036 [Zingiber officinale]KAG6537073.1 hypothetical protein ZIOFF_002153 [Zingiber officinale]
MEFSDHWRNQLPIDSVFSAPNLIPGSTAPVGSLLFSPTSSPPVRFLSSASLALNVPHPLPASSFVHGLRSFFKCSENEAFLSTSAIDIMAAEAALSAAESSASDYLPFNNLAALRCRDCSLVLFFPTGPNANLIGYVGLSFGGPLSPELRTDRDGDIFRVKEGYKHPSHRILKILVAPVAPSSYSTELPSVTAGNPLVEGLLITTSMYSINWFRVETRVSDSAGERPRPLVVPLSTQGFESVVVHVCWNPHFVAESAALLETGELCWFNLQSKRRCAVKLSLDGDDCSVRWLSCEFGCKPWTVIVACSKAVLLVDTGSRRGTGYELLAKIEMPTSLNVSPFMVMNERFLAFCKAPYNDLHFAVVTECRLFLFDVRKPLHPLLTWKHGLDYPSYIAMFRLPELRPANEFKCALESGFVILIGSFSHNVFKLFCYGPRLAETADSPSLYAWDLPSTLVLSDGGISGDYYVREIFSEESSLYSLTHKQMDNMVAGFCIIPSDLFATNSGYGGFSLIRLSLTGKLKMQRYNASTKLTCQEEIEYEGEDQFGTKVTVSSEGCQSTMPNAFKFYRLWHLHQYMNGNLLNALLERDTNKLTNSNMSSSVLPISYLVNEISTPTSIFEVACKKTLNSLGSDLFSLTFSKYSDLFTVDNCGSTFEFLEIPPSFPEKRFLPFLFAKPSRRGEKWFSKSSSGQSLVGPLIPVPVLLALQQIEKGMPLMGKEDSGDDLLDNQCRIVLSEVFPEISISDTTNDNCFGATDDLQAEKSYFVYEPQTCTRSTNRTSIETAIHTKQEFVEFDERKPACLVSPKDEIFSTFLCGVANKESVPDSKYGNIRGELFDLSPVRLDFDRTEVELNPAEQKNFNCLSRQFSKWKENYKPYQDFCAQYPRKQVS